MGGLRSPAVVANPQTRSAVLFLPLWWVRPPVSVFLRFAWVRRVLGAPAAVRWRCVLGLGLRGGWLFLAPVLHTPRKIPPLFQKKIKKSKMIKEQLRRLFRGLVLVRLRVASPPVAALAGLWRAFVLDGVLYVRGALRLWCKRIPPPDDRERLGGLCSCV